ncbi:hypothetical protein MKX03_004305, partial [Papaver bracteatum]
VIVEKAEQSEIQNFDKKKYLVRADLSVGKFICVIRKRIKLSAEKAIFIFMDNVLPPIDITLLFTSISTYVGNVFCFHIIQ